MKAYTSSQFNLQTDNQRGVILSEYLICTLFVGFAMFTPIPGLGDNAFTFMLNALRGFQANTTYLMSLP